MRVVSLLSNQFIYGCFSVGLLAACSDNAGIEPVGGYDKNNNSDCWREFEPINPDENPDGWEQSVQDRINVAMGLFTGVVTFNGQDYPASVFMEVKYGDPILTGQTDVGNDGECDSFVQATCRFMIDVEGLFSVEVEDASMTAHTSSIFIDKSVVWSDFHGSEDYAPDSGFVSVFFINAGQQKEGRDVWDVTVDHESVKFQICAGEGHDC